MTDETIEFPKSAIRQIAPDLVIDFDVSYRNSLRDRAHRLAPILWELTERPVEVKWEEALQDPNRRDAMARCLATCELVIRLVDVLNSPIGR